MESILCSEPMELKEKMPECFPDLNLDQFLDPILKNENRIRLDPYFYTPVETVSQAIYRQEIQKDLLKGENLKLLDDFSREICRLADCEDRATEDLNSGDPWRCHDLLYGHILYYGEQYVALVSDFCGRLSSLEFHSEGLRMGAGMVERLVESDFFQALSAAQRSLREKFNKIQYVMQIKYGTVRVKKYEGEEDLSQKIAALFQKFQSGDQPDYRQELKEEPYADHVEAALLRCVSRLYPGEFQELSAYVKKYAGFTDEGLLKFCRELRFYIDWLRAIEPMKEWNLPFCFPQFQDTGAFGTQVYDLVLANRIGNSIVKNDFSLEGKEQILVITGPNQGGKTTFARALGQIHYLASLGLCVPGKAAGLRLTDQVLCHFGREKAEIPGSGRLQDDLQRLQGILSWATDRSFLVINEIFASTTARDGAYLGEMMLERILKKNTRGVLVTFLSELACWDRRVVSMRSTVDPEKTEVRTFRIVRDPPDPVTYAMTLAEKQGLTYGQVIRRIQE